MASAKFYEFERLVFDPADGRLARIDGSGELRLRPQAGTLLRYLLEHPQTVVDRETLCRAIWGEDTVVDFESGLAALLRELRQAIRDLGADPALIETVPRRGCRLRAAVETRAEGAPTRRQAPGRRGFVFGLLLAGGAALGLLVLWRGSPPPPDSADARQLAILPLERFGDEDNPPRRAGILMADSVLAALWRTDLEHLELIGRAGMRPYAERDDVVGAVAAGLGVDLLFEGSIRTRTDGWQVTLRLLAVPPGRVVWSQTLESADGSLPVAEIADELVAGFATDWPRLHASLDAEQGEPVREP